MSRLGAEFDSYTTTVPMSVHTQPGEPIRIQKKPLFGREKYSSDRRKKIIRLKLFQNQFFELISSKYP